MNVWGGRNQAAIALMFWASVGLTVQGCKKVDQGAPTTSSGGTVATNGSSTIPVGTVSTTAGFSVGVVGKNGHFLMHDSSDTTTYTTPCRVAQTATGAATDISCTVEALEWDLYQQGLELVFNVPKSMCKYLVVMPYWFYSQPVALGPTNIAFYIDAFGTYGIDADEDGLVEVGNENKVYEGTGAGVAISTTVALVAGNPTSIYNATLSGGSNCAVGKYTQTVAQWDSTSNSYTHTPSAGKDWGGKASNCAVGPALDLHPKDKDGFAKYLVYPIEATGINKTMPIVDPMETKSYFSNVYIANWFDPADHPALGFPRAFAQPNLLQGTFTYPSQPPSPYYEFTCMDQAAETLAHIRVQVRDWNSYSEWLKKGSGNPDTTGPEPAPYAGYDVEDRNDWADFGDGALTGFPNRGL